MRLTLKRIPGLKSATARLISHFAGNAETGAGDLNAMFSALEVVPAVSTAVDPKAKLTTTWGALKDNRPVGNTSKLKCPRYSRYRGAFFV